MSKLFSSPSPIIAWARSLPLALVGPILLWTIVVFTFEFFEPDFSIASGLDLSALVGVFSGMLHLFFYALFGLPFFLIAFGRPDSAIWTPLGSVLTGSILGLIPIIFFLALSGEPMGFTELAYALIGMIYGIWTAVCARRVCRRTFKNNMLS